MKLPIRIRASRFNSFSGLEDADGRSICQFQPKGLDPKQTAPVIIAAVNAALHTQTTTQAGVIEKLVEACSALESAILDIANSHPVDSAWIADLPTYIHTTQQWEAFRAALLLAQKEGKK